MPVSTKQLYYVKGANVYSISLYETLAEAGNYAIAIDNSGTTLYAALGAEGASTASHLRVYKDSSIKAVLFNVEAVTALAAPIYEEVHGGIGEYDGMQPVTVTVNNLAYGTVSPSGMLALEGAPISITATAFSGYTFSNWSIVTPNETTTSSDNPVTLTIIAPTQLTANFVTA